MAGTTEQSDAVPSARFSASDMPQAISGVEIAVFDGEAVLFDEASSMLHRLGALAGAVWLYCDGSTDVATIIGELADTFGLEPREVTPVVYDTLERFADEGLLIGHDTGTRMTLTPEPARAADGTEILTRPADP